MDAVIAALSGVVFITCVAFGVHLWWPKRHDPGARSDAGVALMTGAVLTFAVFLLQLLTTMRFDQAEERRERARVRDDLRLQVAITDRLDGIDLRMQDLSGFYLAGKRLTDAKLESADLTGANLSGARLQRARLSDATLRAADLSGANLERAKLTRATFGGHASLEGACLRGADLQGADLAEADLTGADLSHAKYDTRTKLPNSYNPRPKQPCDSPAADRCLFPEQQPPAPACLETG